MRRKDLQFAAVVLLTSLGLGVSSSFSQSPKSCQSGGSALDLLECHNAKRASTAQSTEEYRVILEKLRWVRQTNVASLDTLARVRQLIENHDCVDLHQAIKLIDRGDAAFGDDDQKALTDLKTVISKDYASKKCSAKLSERANF